MKTKNIYSAFNDSSLEISAGITRLKHSANESRDFPFRKMPEWMKRGFSQTATGYGSKLNTGRMVYFNSRWRRLYCIQYSNAGSVYFLLKGQRVFI